MKTSWTEQMSQAVQDNVPGIERWKKATGGKALGWLLTDVPEELIHAAGALPVAVLPGELNLTQAEARLQGFACAYSRSVVELLETNKLEHLDGIIVPYICDTTRALDLLIKYKQPRPFYECLRLPKDTTRKGAGTYYRQELERLRNRLADFTGRYPDAEQLRESIALFNRVRGKLRVLRHMLLEKPGTISAAEYFLAIRMAMIVPKEGADTLLDMAIQELRTKTAAEDARPRIILTGKVPEPPGIIELIEEAGLRIIEDTLALGARYVLADVSEEQDPMDALVARQLKQIPLSGIWDGRPSRAAYLVERARATAAHGVIFLIQKFCEPWEIDYPGMAQELEAQGIKSLRLESDYQASSLEPLRTRVTAFAEMLRTNR